MSIPSSQRRLSHFQRYNGHTLNTLKKRSLILVTVLVGLLRPQMIGATTFGDHWNILNIYSTRDPAGTIEAQGVLVEASPKSGLPGQIQFFWISKNSNGALRRQMHALVHGPTITADSESRWQAYIPGSDFPVFIHREISDPTRLSLGHRQFVLERDRAKQLRLEDWVDTDTDGERSQVIRHDLKSAVELGALEVFVFKAPRNIFLLISRPISWLPLSNSDSPAAYRVSLAVGSRVKDWPIKTVAPALDDRQKEIGFTLTLTSGATIKVLGESHGILPWHLGVDGLSPYTVNTPSPRRLVVSNAEQRSIVDFDGFQQLHNVSSLRGKSLLEWLDFGHDYEFPGPLLTAEARTELQAKAVLTFVSSLVGMPCPEHMAALVKAPRSTSL